MKVFAVIEENWNLDYGYEEYSLPLKVFSTKEAADKFKIKVCGEYQTLNVVECIVED